MLAQNFMTPASLQITDAQFEALFKVLRMLERNEVPHSSDVGESVYHYRYTDKTRPTLFNMYSFRARTECGTACCIGGWAEYLGNLPRSSLILQRMCVPNLDELFDPMAHGPIPVGMGEITPAQAAIALRNYLTTGRPNWAEALTE